MNEYMMVNRTYISVPCVAKVSFTSNTAIFNLSIKDEDGLIFSLSNFALSFDPLKLLNNVRKTERDKKKWVVNRTKERKVIDCWYVWSN